MSRLLATLGPPLLNVNCDWQCTTWLTPINAWNILTIHHSILFICHTSAFISAVVTTQWLTWRMRVWPWPCLVLVLPWWQISHTFICSVWCLMAWTCDVKDTEWVQAKYYDSNVKLIMSHFKTHSAYSVLYK